MKASHYAEVLATSSGFNNFIITCILIAGINVGISTYCPGMGGSPTCRFIDGLDDWILHIFLAECVVKIFAEGLALSQYFCGKEWAWNNFDFIIVAVCLYGYDAGLLRLVRLMRVAKIVRKIPQLQVIVMGLLGGIKSIVYIVILLVIVFYIYGIAGVYAFRDNDPWHFGTLPTAMLTLFRCSTLEDWTDTMYINIYGCHRYPGGIYSQPRDLPVSYGPADASIESLSAFFDSRETALDGNYQCEGFEGKFVTWLASGTTTKHCTSKKAGLDAVTSEVSKWFCRAFLCPGLVCHGRCTRPPAPSRAELAHVPELCPCTGLFL